MTQLPEINWRTLRGKAPTGSRPDGFEELVNQLMIYGGLVEWPAGTTFTTFGNPDGGREGRGRLLPSGDVWVWQAKYLFKFDDSELNQIDKSVQRVLTTEPHLRRYFIVLPCNLPAGDTEKPKKIKSASTRWAEHVAKWEADAAALGRTVTFELIGETALNNCLVQPSQVGRLRYWFDLDSFSDERFRAIAARAEADAGPRYTPELNVALPIAAVFDGLGRTMAFELEIRAALAAVRKARGTYGLSVPEGNEEFFAPVIAALEERLNVLDQAVVGAIAQARGLAGVLPDLMPSVEAAHALLREVAELLRAHCLQDGQVYVGDAGSLHHQTQSLRSAIATLTELCDGRSWRSFGQNAIVVTGTGGAGKTHLLCDLAKARTACDLPTIIALGEQFEQGPIESDLARIIGFSGPPEQLLATFDAACQNAGEIGLVVIDGLNESVDRGLWNKYLNSFLNGIATYSHVRLVLSCRTEFLPDTLSADLRGRLGEYRHTGFDEVSRDAIRQFLDWYNIERPSFPMLDPEFTNPLFLKLLCITLQTRGEHHFPRTGVGTSWIYNSLLGAIDQRLSEPQRCDYDPSSGLVYQAVEQIAAAMLANGRRLLRADVEKLTQSLLPTDRWSRSLLNGLLKEAVLSELLVNGSSYIRFGYERLGDISLAKLVAAESVEAMTVRVTAWAEHWYRNAGVLQALASVLPETHGVELIDLLAIPTTEYHPSAHTDFLLSIAWRRPGAITSRTEELLLSLRTNIDFFEAANNTLLQVATVPDHPLNAEWLHQQLDNMTLPERDATWSHFCDWQDDVAGHLPSLINWAWSEASASANDETRQLTALTLAWTLGSTYRPVRDNASKALIAVLEPAPHLYRPILQRFTSCDDDAIKERLLAVGYAIAQRTLNPAVAVAVGTAVHEFTLGRNYWPQNYLSRDYARRAIDAALDRGWATAPDDLAAQIQPPHTTEWVEPNRTNLGLSLPVDHGD
ncbi:NACHT domain-containing protein [Dactylosporangium sp. CA-152071]|uniref:NACHT domain-containing protein n=1 Tax=Dactylosporangium sp. CA-152071 TaxID=3239933 RepID=UPI003D8E88DC